MRWKRRPKSSKPLSRISYQDMLMTYARARLSLGMSGVGIIVLISLALLISQAPIKLLPTAETWSSNDATALALLFASLAGLILPLDLLGGLVLPNRWRPNSITVGDFTKRWIRGMIAQGLLFFSSSLFILYMGRWLGLPGAILAISSIGVGLVALQLRIAKFVGSLGTMRDDPEHFPQIVEAQSIASSWGWKPKPITMLNHHDTGFTGGIVGIPSREIIVLPASMPETLAPDQLAIVIARRLEAIESGSRSRGLLIAFAWVIVGFALSAVLPGAGVTSVAGLAMTCMGFTLWTFLGLLTLPTLSRQAAYAIDGKILKSGASLEAFIRTIKTLDTLQDDEPQRSSLVESIFHPVPSVLNRSAASSCRSPVAWHAARITLFLSWACMGMLVRTVHCNVGRPELWVMLPTD